jgi:hypothetical protein
MRVYPLTFNPEKNEFVVDGGPGLDPAETEILLPHFCPEAQLPALKAAVLKEYKRGLRRFRITGLYQLALFTDPPGTAEEQQPAALPTEEQAATDGAELILCGAFPLPVANSLAADLLARTEARLFRVQAWVELSRDDLAALKAASPLPLELYWKGRPFLLATRAPVLIEGAFNDSRGGEFELRREAGGLSRIYARRRMELPPLEGMDLFAEEEGQNGGAFSAFNFEGEFK